MPASLLSPLRDTAIAFVDVETTGASAAYGHRVTEIGVVRVEGGQIVSRYQQLVDPERSIGPGVVALTGITQAMVNGQPTFGDQLPALLPLIDGAAVAGHNVGFDLSFLVDEFRRAGTSLADALGRPPVFDTVRLARRRFGRGGNGLTNLAARLGVGQTAAHRALADAETTHGVFGRMIDMTRPDDGWGLSVCDILTAQGGAIPLARPPAPQLRGGMTRGGRPAYSRPAPAEDTGGQDLPWELQEALDAGRPVVMEYLDARENRTERTIQPIRVRHAGGVGTLVAHCHLRGEQRTFKLDRIVRLRPTL